MSVINKPFTFSPNTTMSSSQVNANFDTLYNEINGNLSAANLASDAVTTAKIADSNVTTAKVADSAITTAKINDDAVTPAKLLAGTGTSWAWQAGAPNATGFSSKTSDTLHYIQIGKTIFCRVNIDGTSNANTFTFSLPVAAGATQIISGLRVANNGAFQNTTGLIALTSGSTTATVQLTNTAAANTWTTSNSKAIINNFFYEAA